MGRIRVLAIPEYNQGVKAKPHMRKSAYEKLISHVNRRQWWHVPPHDVAAYGKRGKFFASSFAEAEFYGRPLDEPQRAAIKKPLVGDEKTIAKALRIPPQREGMSLKEIAAHDAKWRAAALAKGYDSIVLMAPNAFAKFRTSGKPPRSLELNVLEVTDWDSKR
jgi:hypothetical protein